MLLNVPATGVPALIYFFLLEAESQPNLKFSSHELYDLSLQLGLWLINSWFTVEHSSHEFYFSHPPVS